MKSTSPVYVVPQRPITLFGIPPLLCVGSLSAGIFAFLICMILQVQALALVMFLLFFAVAITVSAKLSRREIHIETLLTTRGAFWSTYGSHRLWKTSVSQRVLLAGNHSERPIKKGQKQ